MPLKNLTLFTIDDAKHARLWKNAIVVFDSSALLEMYFYSEKTKQVVIDEIFRKLQGRIYMPGQVNYEFLKNRSKVIMKPKGSYIGLEKDLTELAAKLDKYKASVNEFKEKTKKEDKHPFFDQQLFKDLDQLQQQQEIVLKTFNDQVKSIIKTRIDEIEKTVDNDILYNAIDTFFDVGNGFSFTEQMKIIEEGKLRYEFQIPPGYEDYAKEKKDKKEGTQIFGDLFIWKEIILQATEKKCSIIYISNDVKPDWCVKNGSNETYIEHPRHELIKEIADAAGAEFWMYSTPQLLYYAKTYLESEILPEQIHEVNTFANERLINPDNNIACQFTWPVDTTTGSLGEFQREKSLMYLISHNNTALQIDWGDGSLLETVNTRNSIYHQYPDFGEYTVRVYGELFWFCAMGIGPNRGTQYPKVSELTFFNPIHLNRLQCFAGKTDGN